MRQTLGQFIKKVRDERKITQEELSESSGLARSYISRFEDDQFKTPSAMVLIKLAKGLGVSHETIFQIAGYTPKIAQTDLPAFDLYLRTKYPDLSEKAIEDIQIYKELITAKYKRRNK
jgi:transcriptional regulator with XRE-family HTH domain